MAKIYGDVNIPGLEIYTFQHDVSVGTATTATITITTPNTAEQVMFAVEVQAANTGILTFSKVPNFGTGTGITLIDANQRKTGTASTTVEYGGTVTSAGTTVQKFVLGARTLPVTVRGAPGSDHSFYLLNSNTEYLLSFDADNATTSVYFNGYIYEYSQ